MKKTLAYWRKNYSLIPLFAIVAVGVTAATGYGLRVAMYHPEVYWKKESSRDYVKNPYKKLWWYFDKPIETLENAGSSR